MVIKFENIKLISFDLDGTLVDKNSFDVLFWNEEVPKLYAKKHNICIEEAKKIVTEHYHSEIHKGLLKTTNWYRPKHWFNFFDLKEDHVAILKDLQPKIKIYNEVVEVLKKLHKKHKLIIITHSTKEMIKLKVEVEGIKDYFQEIISTPDDFEVVKKDDKIYDIVLKKYNLKPDELLHVGDNKEFDYNVPRKKGVNALFLDRENKKSKKQEEKFTINSLKEIEKYI
ncbi:HAD family hydrolase [Candidatus Woesearchaeota archaeon]|nr:HAD family hydrolase [Candidatus Woesearchaeota archaeon]